MALDFSEFPSPFRLGENLAQPPYSVTPVTPAALVATVYRLQDEVYALAAQVVELREKVQAWEGDS
jgi:hypothetical protein